jgi:uncharacterized RDD family membrane protein YckC
MGMHGVLVGWVVSTLYFAIGNSSLSNGKSLGKRLIAIQVIKTNGDLLTPKEGLIRSLLFTTPYFLFDYVGELFYIPVLSSVFEALRISYYVGLFYFFVVNVPDRRTVHDLIAGTQVRHLEYDKPAISLLSKLKIAGYVGIMVTIVGGFTSVYFIFKGSVDTLEEVVEANMEVLGALATDIYALDPVINVETTKINVTIENEVGIEIQAWVNEDLSEIDGKAIYDSIVNILATKTFHINRIDYTNVELIYGYDIGIANYNIKRSWRKEINTKAEQE